MFRLLASLAAIIAVSSVAQAHHSFIRYDGSKVVRVSGTVTNVRYQNPHVVFTLETPNGAYTVETESVPVLKAKGLTDAVLKSGAKASIAGWVAKGSPSDLGLSSITIDGRTVSVRGSTR